VAQIHATSTTNATAVSPERPAVREVPARRRDPRPTATRRAGSVFVAIVNGGMLWVANHLLGWEWPAFLAPTFEDLLPWVNMSLGAAIAVNLLWTWRDPAWLRHLGQLVMNAISLVVIVRSWQIFPLALTGYWSGWETLARIAIGIAFFGVIIDSVIRLADLTTAATDLTETRCSADREGDRST
jgi:hypothetical protein